MAAATKSPTIKNILGRALRETGAAMKESGRSEVGGFVNMVHGVPLVTLFFSMSNG